jgi:hypothetical protein
VLLQTILGGIERGRDTRACILNRPFAVSAVHVVHNNAARLLNVNKFMERIMALRRARLYARCAQIIISMGVSVHLVRQA